MKEYLVPTGDGEAQFIERRSRFIGHIFLTETEEEALARLKQMREQYWGCEPTMSMPTSSATAQRAFPMTASRAARRVWPVLAGAAARLDRAMRLLPG